MPNVVIATTMWGVIREEIGVSREEELKTVFLARHVEKTGVAQSALKTLTTPPGKL